LIIIFFTADGVSTNKVADWLSYYNSTFEIINDLNPITEILFEIPGNSVDNNGLSFQLKNKKIVMQEEVKAVWYRKRNYYC